ncbi:hypothetical protein N9934_01150 [Desulfosarcina sp.]|nr:hypothetical protein [Desulfosarcina sp.]
MVRLKLHIKNKKGIGELDYISDIIIGMFIVIVLFGALALYDLAKSDSVDTDVEQIDRYAQINQDFLVFLRSPYNSQPHPPHIIKSLDFSDGASYKIINMDSSQNTEFNILMNTNMNMNHAAIEITSTKGSNIAVINGTSDNIVNFFEENDFYPIKINWDELSSDFDKVFVGDSAPIPTDLLSVRDWLYSGGTIISTDNSIAILDEILGEAFIYSNEENMPLQNVKIKFTSEASALGLNGLNGEREMNYAFWVDKIVPGKESVVKVLAEYDGLDSSIWGHPMYSFDYGSGEVIHFTAFLGKNLEEWDKADALEVLYGVFEPKGEHVADVSLTFGSGTIPNYVLTLFHGKNLIDILGHTKLETAKCTSVMCDFPIKVSGSGEVVLKNIQYSGSEKDLYTVSKGNTIADAFVDAYYKDDLSSLDDVTIDFLNKISDQKSSYVVTINLVDKDGTDYITSNKIQGSAGSGRVREVAAYSLPLKNPDEFLVLSIKRDISHE